MIQAIRTAAEQHAAQEFPRESCGLVVGDHYFPCRNMADNTDHFIIHPDDYADADRLGDITAIIHSHPNALPDPSQADRVACEATGLPWHIVSWPSAKWAYLEPQGYVAPLIGRIWAHGVIDCYSLIRDWYRLERGVVLPDFDRTDNWWKTGSNLYADNFAKAGFVRLIDVAPEPGDVLLMQILANVVNHGAIYLGNDIILHHLHSRLSGRDVWAGYFRKHTTHILRYQG
jgi:proteasome lid subunit RPN8/RPN11